MEAGNDRARVGICVPFRPSPERDRLWGLLRERWLSWLPPGGSLNVASDDPAGPWRKGVALANALARTDAEIVVIADADVWGGSLSDAIAMIAAGAPWVQPFDRLIRLTRAATERILAGEDIEAVGADRGSWAERPSVARRPAGGILVLPRETALSVPMDPRFAGWGGEDSAWRDALDTLAGPRVRLAGTLWHLWHEPQWRVSRAQGSRDNERLKRAYARARRRPEAMRELVGEAIASPSSSPAASAELREVPTPGAG